MVIIQNLFTEKGLTAMRNRATVAQHSTAQHSTAQHSTAQANCALFSYISVFSRQAKEFARSFARRLFASGRRHEALNERVFLPDASSIKKNDCVL